MATTTRCDPQVSASIWPEAIWKLLLVRVSSEPGAVKAGGPEARTLGLWFNTELKKIVV